MPSQEARGRRVGQVLSGERTSVEARLVAGLVQEAHAAGTDSSRAWRPDAVLRY